LITPDAYLQSGKILNAIEEAGFNITNLKMAKLSKQDA
jgi:nucleoside diphosphate kinase